MIVSEISTRVKRLFGDQANVQIDDTDIIRWVNDAQHELALQNQLFQTVASVSTVIAQATYTTPADGITLRAIEYNQSKLQALNYNEAEQYIVGTAQSTTGGTPQQFWIWANTINLYPVPDSIGTLKIFYTRQPATVTLVTDTPELPLQYHNAIVQYCLKQAYELDENWQGVQIKSNEFDTATKTLKDNNDWQERDFYPMITSTDTAEIGTGWWWG